MSDAATALIAIGILIFIVGLGVTARTRGKS
jgi:hypothetical protein